MRIAVEIPPGLNSDDTTFASAAWVDGNNVRPWRGKMQVIGGWSDALGGSTLTGVCRNLHAWTNHSSGNSYIVYGTHSKLQIFYQGTLYDITPAGLVTGSIDSAGTTGPGWGANTWGSGTWGSPASIWYARTWAMDNYGSDLMANPRGGTIYRWTGTLASPAVALTNAPAIVTYMLVTPERQVLAFGCNEEVSGNFNPMAIRGSDIEDPTDWTTSSANNAFEHVLEDGGRIVSARIFGPYVAVWTDEAVYLGEFIGAPGQAYRFDKIASSCGLIAPNAVHVSEQTAIWLAPDLQFRVWALGSAPQILPCPIGKEFQDNMHATQQDKICFGSTSSFGETWIHYPDSRDGNENSRYVALGMEGAWFRGTEARTATLDAGIFPYPIKVTVGGMSYFHEYGDTAAGSALNWYLQSADQYLEEGERSVMVQRAIPDFEQQAGDVDLTVYLKLWPNSTAETRGPYTLSTSTLKSDFRATGRLIALKFSGGDATGTFMRMGKPVFEVALAGKR